MIKVTQNVAQYPPHHVIYASVKFEVAKSNGIGEDTITRNEINVPYFSYENSENIYKCITLHMTSVSL